MGAVHSVTGLWVTWTNLTVDLTGDAYPDGGAAVLNTDSITLLGKNANDDSAAVLATVQDGAGVALYCTSTTISGTEIDGVPSATYVTLTHSLPLTNGQRYEVSLSIVSRTSGNGLICSAVWDKLIVEYSSTPLWSNVVPAQVTHSTEVGVDTYFRRADTGVPFGTGELPFVDISNQLRIAVPAKASTTTKVEARGTIAKRQLTL